jgi:hypothetical protein
LIELLAKVNIADILILSGGVNSGRFGAIFSRSSNSAIESEMVDAP